MNKFALDAPIAIINCARWTCHTTTISKQCNSKLWMNATTNEPPRMVSWTISAMLNPQSLIWLHTKHWQWGKWQLKNYGISRRSWAKLNSTQHMVRELGNVRMDSLLKWWGQRSREGAKNKSANFKCRQRNFILKCTSRTHNDVVDDDDDCDYNQRRVEREWTLNAHRTQIPDSKNRKKNEKKIYNLNFYLHLIVIRSFCVFYVFLFIFFVLLSHNVHPTVGRTLLAVLHHTYDCSIIACAMDCALQTKERMSSLSGKMAKHSLCRTSSTTSTDDGECVHVLICAEQINHVLNVQFIHSPDTPTVFHGFVSIVGKTWNKSFLFICCCRRRCLSEIYQYKS